eukprot:6186246-Pleurochrysis_carterae.AAC.1
MCLGRAITRTVLGCMLLLDCLPLQKYDDFLLEVFKYSSAAHTRAHLFRACVGREEEVWWKCDVGERACVRVRKGVLGVTGTSSSRCT